MVKKRVTRKQLLKEPDEFITFSNRMIKLGVAYKQQLMIAAGVLCVAVLVFVTMQYISGRSRAKAFSLLESAVARYDRVLAQNGPEKAVGAVEADFELILKKYGSNTGGQLARVTYGQYNYAAGRADRAIALYETALADFDEDPLYRAMIVSGLGYTYALKGDLPKAISYFEQVVSGSATGFKNDALFQLGLLYAQTGQKAKSAESFKRISDENPESFYAEMAGGKASL
ncbi:MAG: tetratricopeptide repeat protein [Desulfobacterales bacterium]|nr:tetratricopeptide repeat protein [Desulfobacterales bacterium]